jgi:hypothetical protein
MDKIILTFESLLPQISLLVKVNNTNIDYTIQDNCIIIHSQIQFGINSLSLELLNDIDNAIKLVDVVISGVNLRQTMYLAYSTHANGDNFCNTWLTNSTKQLTLPFGNPVSYWLAECSKKLPNKSYGTNLYERYDIYYPQSVKIKDSFPKLMQDFMQYDFGFTLIDKLEPIKGNKLVPWLPIKFDYDELALFEEFVNNIDLIKNNYYEPKQNQYNSKESKNIPNWIVAMAVHSNTSKNIKTETNDGLVEELDRQRLPLFYNLLDRIRAMNIKILHAFIGVVEPGSYVAPHCDDFYKYEPQYKTTAGVAQFFIPLGWKPGNLFKFNNVGMIPWENGPYLVNNSDFMHGSVNDTPYARFTIGVYCEFTDDNIQQLKKNS